MALTADELAQAMTDALAGSGLNQSIANLVSATTSLEATIKGLPPGSIPAVSTAEAENASRLRETSQDISDSTGEAAKNGEILGTHFKKAKVSGDSLLDTMIKIGGAALEGASKISKFASQMSDSIREQTDLVVTLDRSIQEAYGNVRYAQFSSSTIGKSVQSVLVTSLKELTDMSSELRDTNEANIVNIRGQSESALSYLFGVGQEGQNALTEAMKGIYGEGKTSTELFFADLDASAINTSLAIGKALDISAANQAALIDISIERTGKASTDLIQEVGAFSLKIQQTTGANIKKVADGVTELIKDVETFGDIGVESAARITGALINLGVEMESFSGLVSKFMNFDTAVSSVSDLTSVFGLQLDAMELFRLANQDEEELLKTVREEFLSQGIAVEDLNKAELNLIKTRLGMSSIGDVKNFLREGTAGFDEMAAATEDVDVAGSFESIVVQGEDVAITMKKIDQALKSNEMLRQAEKARTLALSFDQATISMGKLYERSTREVRRITTEIALEGSQLIVDTTNKLFEGGLEAAAQNVEGFFKGLEQKAAGIYSSAIDTVLGGITDSKIASDFKDFFTAENMMPAFFKGSSPSPFGYEIIKGITDPDLKVIITDFLVESYSSGIEKIIELQETKLMPAIISNFESFESMISSQVLEPNTEFLNNLVDERLQSSAQNLTGALQNAQVDLSKKAIESIDLGVEVTGDSITATAVPITDSIGKLKESAEANLDLQKKIVENGNELLNSMTQLIDGVSNLKSAMETPSVIENKTVLNLNGRVLAEVVRDNSYNPSTGEAVLISNEYDLN